jgi:hypothetical protein
VTNGKSSKSSFSKSALEQFQFEVASELGLADKLKSSSSSVSSSSSESSPSK